MDVVALAQYGVTQAVATLGTATTPDHAELLFRNAPDVFFCFDGDRAGRSAAWKALESVLPRMKDGRQAFFLFLPEGEDPDTIVRKEGADGFRRAPAQAMPLSEFFFAELGKDVNLGTLDGKARLAERCKPLLAQIPDGAFGDLMRQRLTELTGVGARASTPETHVPAQRARNAPAVHAPQAEPGPQRDRAAAAPAGAGADAGAAVPLRAVAAAGRRTAGRTWSRWCASGPRSRTGALLEHFSDREEAVALQKLATQTLPGEEALWRNEFADVDGAAGKADAAAAHRRTAGQASAISGAGHARQGRTARAARQPLRALMRSRRSIARRRARTSAIVCALRR